MMKSIIVALCFVGLVAAWDVKVTLNVMSGGVDPSWTVTGAAADQLMAQLPADAQGDVLRPIPYWKLGYRGFEVEASQGDALRAPFVIYNNYQAELALLASGNTSVLASVLKHVIGEADRLSKINWALVAPISRPMDMMPPVNDPNAPCDIPVRGPDNGTTYDPLRENCGFWTSHCSANNCYNYGNDIVTDTFAQPGRGSGQKWSSNTCADIRASAERDGLIWAGTDLPKANPDKGHYVALFIWPNTNFHWIRFDSIPAGYWSHKPGGTPARNVDGNGQKITDPSKSDFSPWTQFCGYMSTVPSTVTIG